LKIFVNEFANKQIKGTLIRKIFYFLYVLICVILYTTNYYVLSNEIQSLPSFWFMILVIIWLFLTIDLIKNFVSTINVYRKLTSL